MCDFCHMTARCVIFVYVRIQSCISVMIYHSRFYFCTEFLRIKYVGQFVLTFLRLKLLVYHYFSVALFCAHTYSVMNNIYLL